MVKTWIMKLIYLNKNNKILYYQLLIEQLKVMMIQKQILVLIYFGQKQQMNYKINKKKVERVVHI